MWRCDDEHKPNGFQFSTFNSNVIFFTANFRHSIIYIHFSFPSTIYSLLFFFFNSTLCALCTYLCCKSTDFDVYNMNFTFWKISTNDKVICIYTLYNQRKFNLTECTETRRTENCVLINLITKINYECNFVFSYALLLQECDYFFFRYIFVK